ncbi:sugar ABC transporter substrate-binding protein [Paracoccus sp. APAP_BH8]|uniref:ABC transporter substrate-binding protein n=1 Tax=Paracoccus sp. APAP_BH8 TaxID=3110237 RepID=UPI002FD859BB
MKLRTALLAATAITLTGAAQAEELTIATVNNGDMIIMQKLAPEWEKATGHKINWVILEENVLRQRVTTDIATRGGQFDIMTVGSYEAPIWGKQGWLMPLDDLGEDYDYGDLIPSVAAGLSADGKLVAAPFYAESSFTMYRKDLFEAAGLTMPEQPTYDQIAEFAEKLTDKSKEQYGICLRGKPGWGENMAFLGTLVNTYGGQWFDMDWQPQINSQPWQEAITYYVDLMTKYGPPGAVSNGFNENQALFQTGKCAIWIDATSAAGRIFDPKQSEVADKIAFAPAPQGVTPAGSAWFWAWSLAIPSSSTKADVAKSFIAWATSKDYVRLVGEHESEVAILSTAVHWNAPYVIANHQKHALKAGLGEEVVAAILDRRRPDGLSGRLGVVADAVWDILNGGMVGDAAFVRYDTELGRELIAELLVTIGYFTSVSLAMSLHALAPKA